MVDVKIPFSLYDIWANIFPGMFLILIIVAENFKLDISVDFLTISFFVFAAYVAGQLIQGLGHFFRVLFHSLRVSLLREKLRIELDFKPERYPSEYFISKNNKWFSEPFRKKLDGKICSVFKVPHNANPLEKFDLCYMYVTQKGFGERAERFLSLYGFYRGMLISSILAIAVSIINLYAFKTSAINATNILIISILLAISAIIFFNRSARFDKKFAQEIYEQFYVASFSKK